MYNIDNIKNFPDESGCYIMKDSGGKIIYIGKAKNIKKRVMQYFNGQDKRPKVTNLVKVIDTIEYVITDSELEALILENNLIKENKPFFNTMLKDDRQYPFIKITNEEYPRIELVKRIENDNAYYYGPYTDTDKIKNILNILQKEYKLKKCNNFENNGCLYYQIGRCSAPCINKIQKDEYDKNVKSCIEILSGKINILTKKLTKDMQEAAQNLEYEKAATIRDEIKSIKYITNKQFVQLQTDENEDIIVSRNNIIVLFRIRDGKLIAKQHFLMTDDEEIVTEFIMQFYSGVSSVSSTIYIEKELENVEILKQFLSRIVHKKVDIKVPKKGDKKKILDLAIKNADVLVNEQIRKQKTKEEKQIIGIKNIEKLLGFSIKRIEAYDISNTSGVENVGSMSVFIDGKAQRKLYRKFKLNIVGMDDYKCMEEMLHRRFTDEKMTDLPDVLFMDGGKGQITSALNVLKELSVNIPVCGMVKDDNHRTRALIYNGEELDIKNTSPEFKLITFIQDETHNFAINYHRNIRSKKMVKSVLDDIKGLGEVRKKLLLSKFGTLENIKNSSTEELTNIPGINEQIANNILTKLREDN